MTSEEQKVATGLLETALRAQLLAAQTFVKLVEFVDFDPEQVKEARRMQSRLEHQINETMAKLSTATPEGWRKTFEELGLWQ